MPHNSEPTAFSGGTNRGSPVRRGWLERFRANLPLGRHHLEVSVTSVNCGKKINLAARRVLHVYSMYQYSVGIVSPGSNTDPAQESRYRKVSSELAGANGRSGISPSAAQQRQQTKNANADNRLRIMPVIPNPSRPPHDVRTDHQHHPADANRREAAILDDSPVRVKPPGIPAWP